MKTPEQRLAELGWRLPPPLALPPGVDMLFPMVNRVDDTLFISGHLALEDDGTPAGPFGKVGADVPLEDAHASAGRAAVAMIGSVKRELGELSRVRRWGSVLGFVNCAPDFTQHTAVVNGFFRVILDVFGDEVGRHARSAVGVAALPMNFCLEIEAQLRFHP
ncbi:MAG: RidA family protein [Pseudomonadota bacterium]|nr:RidA family protein [Pseudomonadota bacterium]